jgi:alpha-ketoglutarate-dependent taurine dioxygenase
MSATATNVNVENYGLSVIPQQPRLGAEIYGIDLRASLTDELRNELKQLLVQYKVLFFRDQDINREQHIALGLRRGQKAQ